MQLPSLLRPALGLLAALGATLAGTLLLGGLLPDGWSPLQRGIATTAAITTVVAPGLAALLPGTRASRPVVAVLSALALLSFGVLATAELAVFPIRILTIVGALLALLCVLVALFAEPAGEPAAQA